MANGNSKQIKQLKELLKNPPEFGKGPLSSLITGPENFVIGAGKGLLGTLRNVPASIESSGKFLGTQLGKTVFGEQKVKRAEQKFPAAFKIDSLSKKIIPEKITKQKGVAQKLGGLTEDVAEFVFLNKIIPSASLAKKLNVTKVPKFLTKIFSTAGKAARTGGIFGIQTGLETGSAKKAKKAATLGAEFELAVPPVAKALEFGLLKPLNAGGKALLNKSPQLQKFLLKSRLAIFDRAAKLRDISKQNELLKPIVNLLDTYKSAASAKMDNFYKNKFIPIISKYTNDVGAITEDLAKANSSLSENTIKSLVNKADKKALQQTEQKLIEDPMGALREYLKLKHVPEYNKALGEKAAGITTMDAVSKLKEIRKLPFFSTIQSAEQRIRRLSNEYLDFVVNQGLVKKEVADALRKKYKNYVPFNRILEDDISNSLNLGRGVSVGGSPIKAAKGSEKEIGDVLANLAYNWQVAIAKAERNQVSNSIRQFIIDNPDNPLFKLIPGQFKTFKKKVGQEVADIPTRFAPKGKNVIEGLKDGKRFFIEAPDNDIAKALGIMDKIEIGPILSKLQAFNRFFSAINTTYNLGFPLVNFFKDSQAAVNNLRSQFGDEFVAGFKSSVPSSMRGISDNIRGKSTELSKLYSQAEKDGAFINFFRFEDRENFAKQFDKMAKDLGKLALGGKPDNKKSILEGFKSLNELFENSTRFASYREALAKGLSRKEAASVARNATVDFGRKGTLGPMMSAYRSFLNASLQGSYRTFQSLKNPREASKSIAKLVVPAQLINQWNFEVDPSGYESIIRTRPWLLETNYVIMLGDGEYVALPLPWGWNAFKVMSDNIDFALRGNIDFSDSVKRSAIVLMNAYNPLGGGTLISQLSPTALAPVIGTAANQTWYGGSINPTNFKGVKDSLNKFDSTNPVFAQLAGLISKATGGKGLEPGAVEISPNSLEYLWEQYSGGATRTFERIVNGSLNTEQESIDPSQIPVARRFFGKVIDDKANKFIMFDIQNKGRQKLLNEKELNEFTKAVEDLVVSGKLTREQASKKLNDLARNQEDREMVQTIINKYDISKMPDDFYQEFRQGLTTKEGASQFGVKPFNKTQLLELDTFR